MLPDVAAEAIEIMQGDEILKGSGNQGLANVLQQRLGAFKDDASKVNFDDYNAFRSLTTHLSSRYSQFSADAADAIVNSGKPSLVRFEQLIEHFVSYAKASGWSDAGVRLLLADGTKEHSDPVEIIRYMSRRVTVKTPYECRVQVKAQSADWTLLGGQPKLLRVESPAENECLVAVTVSAADRWSAAYEAYTHVASVIGAANVFLTAPISVAESDVLVTDAGEQMSIYPIVRFKRDPHHPRKDQLPQVVNLAASAMQGPGPSEHLYDAIRCHHRASISNDIESAFVLLWTGLERICSDPVRWDPVLRSTTSTLAPALAFGKVRREVSSLSEALAREVKAKDIGRDLLVKVQNDVQREDPYVVSHDSLMAAICAPDDEEARKFLKPFYDNVLLTQWFVRLRKDFKRKQSVSDWSRAIAKVIRRSHQHTEWQVKRLYRARNGAAHGFDRPQWVTELARHASYYLTNAIAICINYSSSSETPVSILRERVGWYQAYIQMLEGGVESAVSADKLLRPSKLFGAG